MNLRLHGTVTFRPIIGALNSESESSRRTSTCHCASHGARVLVPHVQAGAEALRVTEIDRLDTMIRNALENLQRVFPYGVRYRNGTFRSFARRSRTVTR